MALIKLLPETVTTWPAPPLVVLSDESTGAASIEGKPWLGGVADDVEEEDDLPDLVVVVSDAPEDAPERAEVLLVW